MPIPRRLRLAIPLLAFFFFSTSADELSVVSHPSKLKLPSGRPVEGSPGSRPGSVMTCNRVHIHGVSRLRHPSKYAHSLKVHLSVAQGDALFRIQTIELCFHRNASIGVGMCPPGEWQKLSKNSWVQSMSPYGYGILDLRMLPDPSRTIEISTEEEFLFHRLVFLILGMIMMMMARFVSESVVFYYGGAMTLGIMVVILMVLFQGMRLLPTGRRSSLAIFMYSSVVGLGAFLLRYVSGLLRTILVEIGISEDMHNPLGILLFVCLILAGAWFGYWGVRKFVLTEDGLVDSGVAYFVEWAIYILSAVMILQSSLDTLFAAEVLGFVIIVSAITRTHGKSRFLRRLFRRMIKSVHRTQVRTSPSYSSHAEYSRFQSPGSPNRRPRMPFEENYYSTFHRTPERREFSKEEWDIITKEHTNKALKDLVSSRDFNQWALANVDRIVVTPPQDHRHERRRRIFGWL
ncbi:uncharacterized protein [Elaeis guineensis]|uniref:Uncharacterized protein LOC105057961 isoform X2 n=1 Tax=Elaeis guineensis var. tenera TaxID=51953 RepID=A0A6J0PRH8_ELAGV|nr:uncharacterized protein LOC105057961 isoform X2 [Elaeis guineensis]